jgi:murein DD-endopeptidase MepM/ murein hydrolase activator NlpD
VFIEHVDGTVGRYFHLTRSGADVSVGQQVASGQRIGRSGNSGNSSAPHLHFDVVERRCAAPWPEGPYSDPCHNTLPISFRNTRPQACGLQSGAQYTALSQ